MPQVNLKKSNPDSLGIYIHIPFCKSKCKYCDFLSAPSDDATKSTYVNALLKEIKLYGFRFGKHGINRAISTIFIGGGTPSILPSIQICRILDTIQEYFSLKADAEITIECNPGTLDKIKLTDYKSVGINRLSLGLQTTNEAELKAIGRIHTYQQFLESYNTASLLGFKNINIDLMSALPYQTINSYKDTLEKILSLKPSHISSYSLILEEGTPLYDFINAGNSHLLPDEDTEREMYYLTDEMLSLAGYNRYEISNYSKPGYECRHNLSYWERKDYLGIGLGASSFINETRYRNITNLKEYIKLLDNSDFPDSGVNFLHCDITPLSLNDQMEEYMFLGLRKTKGISISEFKSLFNKDIFDVFHKPLEKYEKLKLLTVNNDTIALTGHGIDVSNTIFSDFLLEE